MYNIFQ